MRIPDCRGFPLVGFTWHVEGPGIEPRSVRNNKFEKFSQPLRYCLDLSHAKAKPTGSKPPQSNTPARISLRTVNGFG